MATRSFSDDEVARILARAAELQVEKDKRDTDIVDIERAAAEAGIDPALVRAAARELDGAPPPERAGYFGPTAIDLQLVIDGVVAAEDHERLNDAFQQVFGLPVQASRLGNSLHWSYLNPQGARHLQASVAVRDGRTIVRVREGLAGLMGGIYGGVGGGAGVGGVIPALAIGGAFLLGPVGGVAGGLVGTAVSFFGTRAIYLLAARRRQRQAQRAFDALTNEVRAAARPVERAADSLAAARERQGLADAPQVESVEDKVAVDVTAATAKRAR